MRIHARIRRNISLFLFMENILKNSTKILLTRKFNVKPNPRIIWHFIHIKKLAVLFTFYFTNFILQFYVSVLRARV